MTSFTPPEINLGGVVQALLIWAITPQAIVIGAATGILGKRWYDAFWAFPILIAYQLISHPSFRETLLSNPANLLVGLAPIPWALLILIVKQVRARRH